MRLTQSEFDQLKAQKRLKIALIGMSNIGKSHWAKQIADVHGFSTYEVDTAIQEKLSLSTITQSAEWMGHPYEEEYSEKSDQYMALETELTLVAPNDDNNLVLDTTGSVVHICDQDKRNIKNNYLTVYLKADEGILTTLIERFNETPKPLIWDIFYKQFEGLSSHENMIKSYPELLKSRSKLYENLADITLDVSRLKTTKTTDFLTALRNMLPEI